MRANPHEPPRPSTARQLAGAAAAQRAGASRGRAPAHRAPLAVVAWVVTSVLFGLYVTEVASYGSLFGSFASIFVLLSYVYLSAIAFLAGVEVDALVRERVVPSSDG